MLCDQRLLFGLRDPPRLPLRMSNRPPATGSWCSPAQNGNNNQVICNGVHPRAMARLNELLDLKDLSLSRRLLKPMSGSGEDNRVNDQFEGPPKKS